MRIVHLLVTCSLAASAVSVCQVEGGRRLPGQGRAPTTPAIAIRDPGEVSHIVGFLSVGEKRLYVGSMKTLTESMSHYRLRFSPDHRTVIASIPRIVNGRFRGYYDIVDIVVLVVNLWRFTHPGGDPPPPQGNTMGQYVPLVGDIRYMKGCEERTIDPYMNNPVPSGPPPTIGLGRPLVRSCRTVGRGYTYAKATPNGNKDYTETYMDTKAKYYYSVADATSGFVLREPTDHDWTISVSAWQNP